MTSVHPTKYGFMDYCLPGLTLGTPRITDSFCVCVCVRLHDVTMQKNRKIGNVSESIENTVEPPFNEHP